MPSKLRDLIRAIRAAKTAADERDVINKECAAIRNSFRAEDNENRARSMAKLLYIHMLGYPAHFGQLECLKLVVSGRFSDKRIGYLSCSMLLDESKDVHLLVTNSLKNDLNHHTQYVTGLALCTMGSICSVEMARDLAGEVEKLLKSSNSYIRKKAVLCALRIIRKVPDLMENFVPATRSLLGERNHGVLVTGVSLITEMCILSPESLGHFRRLVPTLVRTLKNLVMAGYSPEHDVSGTTDPFLQVQILRLLRILGKGNAEASETMNDILAQVATNTESSKNVGNAILYEAVMCIMDINAESGLRVLAINILGKFLLNHDRNIRYVALTTLLRTVQTTDSVDAIQRHRNTVVDCLKEPDITIRRRAMVLVFALINSSNIRSLVDELLDFLDYADSEFKEYMTTELFMVAEKHAPSRSWQIETIIQVLAKAGSYMQEDVIAQIIHLFADSPDHHAYIVLKMFEALSTNFQQTAQAQIGCWCIGEYGDLLLHGLGQDEKPVSSGEVLDLLQTIINSPIPSPATRGMALMAVMKLSTRFPAEIARIRALIGKYGTHVDIELQQRSAEFTTVFNMYNDLRPGLLERMPVPERTANTVASSSMRSADMGQVNAAEEPSLLGDMLGDATPAAAPSGGNDLLDLLGGGPTSAAPTPAAPAAGGDMMDLLGLDLGGGSAPAPVQPAAASGGNDLLDLLGGGPPATSAPMQPSSGGGDLLGDLMGMGMGSQPTPAPTPAAPMSSLLDFGGAPTTTAAPAAGNDFDMFAGLGGSSPAATTPAHPSVVVMDQQGLKVEFSCNKISPTEVQITVTSTNSSPSPMAAYTFRAAVPKAFTINLASQSSAVVPPNGAGSVTQVATVNNPSQQPLRMRLLVTFTQNGSSVELKGQVDSIPGL